MHVRLVASLFRGDKLEHVCQAGKGDAPMHSLLAAPDVGIALRSAFEQIFDPPGRCDSKSEFTARHNEARFASEAVYRLTIL
jgi:hypothetical protein